MNDTIIKDNQHIHVQSIRGDAEMVRLLQAILQTLVINGKKFEALNKKFEKLGQGLELQNRKVDKLIKLLEKRGENVKKTG